MIHPCSIVRDPNTSACELNHDLKFISRVGSPMENFTQIPLNKPVQVHVKPAKLLILKFSLMILKLKLSMGHKHLGLTLDTKLTFASHIDEKLKKASKGIGIIKNSLSLFVGINS